MTKSERKSELKEQKRFFKALDKIFDRDWREFVKGIQKENALFNLRMLKALASVKGEAFAADLVRFMKVSKVPYNRLRIANKPSGVQLKDSRFETIPEIWVQQKSTYYGASGSVFIQVKSNRWVYFGYQQETNKSVDFW